jgi:hypothetical protein
LFTRLDPISVIRLPSSAFDPGSLFWLKVSLVPRASFTTSTITSAIIGRT